MMGMGPYAKDFPEMPPVGWVPENPNDEIAPEMNIPAGARDEADASQETGEKFPYYLKAPELPNLYPGKELPREMWELLLGDEVEETIRALLKNEGDSLVVSGGSIAKIALGAYPVDLKSGKVPLDLRSDVDIYITQPGMLEIASEVTSGDELRAKAGSLEGFMCVKEEGQVEIDLMDAESLLKLELDSLEQLEAWAVQKNWRKLDEVRKMKGVLEQVDLEKPDDYLIWSKIHATLPHEGMALRFELHEGDLRATFLDPYEISSSQEVRYSIEEQMFYGEYVGVQLPMDGNGLKGLFLEAMVDMDDPVEFDSKVPLWALETIPRLIRADAEMDLGFADDYIMAIIELRQHYGENDASMQEAMDELWKDYMDGSARPELRSGPTLMDSMYFVAEKISKTGKLPFSITGLTAQHLQDRGYSDEMDWFITKVQEGYARATRYNDSTALAGFFYSFPLGKFIAPRMAERLSSFHEDAPYPLSPTSMTFFSCTGEPSIRRPEMSWIDDYGKLEYWEFGVENTSMIYTSGMEMQFPNVARAPLSMSEMLSLQAYTLGISSSDTKFAEEAVANWRISGLTKGVWGTLPFDFETGLTVDEILSKMSQLEQLYGKRTAQNV